MASEETKLKEPEKSPGGAAESTGALDVYSLDDLDNILKQEDPSFSESMDDIKKQTVEDTSSIEGLSVEGESDENLDRDEDEAPSMRRKWWARLKQPFVRIGGFVKLRYLALRNRTLLLKTQTVDFVKHDLPDRIGYVKSQIRAYWGFLKAAVARFRARPGREKLGIVVIFLCAVGTLYFLQLTFASKWMPSLQRDFVADLGRHGTKIGTVASLEDMLPMAEAFPEVEFQVRLDKIIVNLRRAQDESGLPMGVFEFFLGVDSKDTAVEIRDREKEMLDLVQRTVEGFTYNEVMSYAGKIRVKSRIRDNINTVLNQGEVRRVYIHSMVTNH